MARFYTPLCARFAAFCWGVGALSCTDLAAPDHLSAGLGGQSGDGSGIGGGQTGDGTGIAKIGVVQCPHKYSPWQGAIDEELPELNLTPKDVLETVETTVEETFGWVLNERLKLEHVQTEVAVDLHYEQGEIRVRRSTEQEVRTEVADLAPPVSYVSRASQYCGTVLEIEVEASLTTADGVLDESFSVVVTANTRGAAHFEGWLPKALDGSLGERISKKDERLYVAAMITPLGSSGEVVAIPLPQAKDEVPGSAERVGSWPVIEPGTCQDSGYGTLVTSSVPNDDVRTLSSLLSMLAPTEVPLTWNLSPAWPQACSADTLDAPACTTTLHVEVDDVPETWCASVTPFESSFTASAPVELTLSTADEQWQGSYAALGVVTAFDDGTQSLELSTHQQGVVASGEALGFPNLRLTAHSEATLGIGITAGVEGNNGYVSVFGHPETKAEADAGVPEAENLIGASLGAPPITP